MAVSVPTALGEVPGTLADERAIREVIRARRTAWNSDNGARYRELITEDANIISATGRSAKGQGSLAHYRNAGNARNSFGPVLANFHLVRKQRANPLEPESFSVSAPNQTDWPVISAWLVLSLYHTIIWRPSPRLQSGERHSTLRKAIRSFFS